MKAAFAAFFMLFRTVLIKLCPFDKVARQYFVDIILNVGFNQVYF
jgi:hypothetical protein